MGKRGRGRLTPFSDGRVAKRTLIYLISAFLHVNVGFHLFIFRRDFIFRREWERKWKQKSLLFMQPNEANLCFWYGAGCVGQTTQAWGISQLCTSTELPELWIRLSDTTLISTLMRFLFVCLLRVSQCIQYITELQLWGCAEFTQSTDLQIFVLRHCTNMCGLKMQSLKWWFSGAQDPIQQ